MFLSKRIFQCTLLVMIAASFCGCATAPSVTTATTSTESTDSKAPKKIGQDKNIPRMSEYDHKEYLKALNYIKSKNYKKSKVILVSLTKEYPQLSEPYANLGLAHLALEEFDQAESMFTKSIEINQNRADIYNSLGVLYRKQGKFEDAKSAYEKAITIDGNYAFAHLNLGILYDLFLNRPVIALRHYQQYVKLNGTDSNTVTKWIADLKRRTQTGT